MRRKNVIKLIENLSVLVLICLPTLWWTLNQLDKYPLWDLFLFIFIFLGIILGFLIFKIITTHKTELKKYKTNKGVSLISVIMGISILLTPLFGVIINENLGVTLKVKSYKIDKIGASGGGGNSRTIQNYIFIINNKNKVERLSFGEKFVTDNSSKDSLLLNLNTGFLGFSFYDIP